MLNILSIIISILALISSAIIGKKQVELSQKQSDAQNKVELYLLPQLVTVKGANGMPDKLAPVINIRNVGNNVIYLDKYLFNGRVYPLGKEVLPPVSIYDCFHYIDLPTDGTIHVSLEILFHDWQNQTWKTTGYADLRNGVWEMTYSPCERQ